MKERIEKQEENINIRLQQIENTLKEKQIKQGFFDKFRQWI